MRHEVVLVHANVPALAGLADALREAGMSVHERTVAVGAAAYVLRARPSLAIVHATLPLVAGVHVVRSIVEADPTRATRVLLYDGDDTPELKGLAAESGADDRIFGFGPPLLEAASRWLPTARRGLRGSSSGTRLRGVGRYLLIAASESTRLQLVTLQPEMHRHLTDSGTEALRLICSPSPPAVALIGSSLTDLPCTTVLETALRVNPGWRSRLVLIAEHSVGPVADAVERADALVWSDHEPLQGLMAIVERLRRAG